MINYHKHLFNCEHNKSIKAACIACKWEKWQNAKSVPTVVGKTFEEQMTKQDAELLHEMLISWRSA